MFKSQTAMAKNLRPGDRMTIEFCVLGTREEESHPDRLNQSWMELKIDLFGASFLSVPSGGVLDIVRRDGSETLGVIADALAREAGKPDWGSCGHSERMRIIGQAEAIMGALGDRLTP